MELGALGCMHNADFEKKKVSIRQHSARCVYYLSEITSTSNLKNAALGITIVLKMLCYEFNFQEELLDI